MITQTVSVSEKFRVQAQKAVFSIILFVIVFLLMIALAVGLLIKCVSWAMAIVMASPGFITLVLGIGLIGMGFLVLFFLIKFLFKTHKVDRSHLVEITREEQTRLFQLIDEIVADVGTTFPKRVYLSADVNAAVFYDSSFWSMFLPIKKNLQIGMGLVNTVTEEEFRGVLAHEFGHFSQRSMKVGSYVYNVNQIIYNMLYDNQGFDNIVQRWASASWYFAIFVIVAIKIVQGIQWILGKLYRLINLSYMSLSREMEFHADEVAAYATGSAPLGQSLLRIDMAQQALSSVLQFYGQKMTDGTISANVYPQQTHALQLLAKENKVPVIDGLPVPESADLHQFTTSKIVIKNQWASHPSTADRVAALKRLDVAIPRSMPGPANKIFNKLEQIQEQMTRKLFVATPDASRTNVLELDAFISSYKEHMEAGRFHPIYNGYFDQRNPHHLVLDAKFDDTVPELAHLLNDEKVALANEWATLENDLAILERISSGETAIKTFDYDGRKYLLRECKALIVTLKRKVEDLEERLRQNDQDLYQAFYCLAADQGKADTLKDYYRAYFDFDRELTERLDIYLQVSQRLQFTTEVTPIEQIHSNFAHVEPFEDLFKEKIKALIEDEFLNSVITATAREQFEKYLSKKWRYFGQEIYFEESLNVLWNALEFYQHTIYRAHFQLRKRILDFQASLIDE